MEECQATSQPCIWRRPLRLLLSSYSRISERDHPLGMYTPAMVFVAAVRWKWKIGRDVRPEDTKSMAW